MVNGCLHRVILISRAAIPSWKLWIVVSLLVETARVMYSSLEQMPAVIRCGQSNMVVEPGFPW